MQFCMLRIIILFVSLSIFCYNNIIITIINSPGAINTKKLSRRKALLWQFLSVQEWHIGTGWS